MRVRVQVPPSAPLFLAFSECVWLGASKPLSQNLDEGLALQPCQYTPEPDVADYMAHDAVNLIAGLNRPQPGELFARE